MALPTLNFVAVPLGPAGNLISVGLIDLGIANTPLSVAVSGSQITVTVHDDGTGANASTSLQVVNAINAFGPAAALVVASTPTPAVLVDGLLNIGYTFLSGGSASATGGYLGQDLGNFKILLLDTNQVQVSNVPLLFTNFFHVPDTAVNLSAQSSAQAIPKNFWPTPPMTYRANTSIRFYIYATSATPLGAPVSFDITFRGVRRYPCK
jgi:hypothetical protein